MKIAIYGKGGIGKSTIAANLSAAWAARGLHVLHLGCDPKSDSTRLLLGRRAAVTVLDYLRRTGPERRALADIMAAGFGGVHCIEAGGPEPGVGCAGRGILSTFAVLDELGLAMDPYDVVVYDVLGDVVCGGFAVPLRREFADEICLVTSGEFMSLYAANNILRGVQNYEGRQPRVRGILLNRRGLSGEQHRVARFAEAVGLPILATIPRSDLFRRAEAADRTLAGFARDSDPARRFASLARQLVADHRCFRAAPLADEDLEVLLLDAKTDGAPPSGHASRLEEADPLPAQVPLLDFGNPPPPASPYRSKSVLCREALHGCAFAGALNITTQVRDAVTVVHGPANCVHIAAGALIASGVRMQRRHGVTAPGQLCPALHLSAIDDHGAVFGAVGTLAARIREALESPARAVFVATTCPSGIIGEDVDQVLRGASADGDPKPVMRITTDGNLAGDYMQGVINACVEGAGALIDADMKPAGRQVNIVAEKNIAANTEPNFQAAVRMLEAIGVGVNCRFVFDTTVARLRGFKRAALNLLAYDDHFGRELRRFLQERHGAVFAETPFPVGARETRRWLREIAAFFDVAAQAEAVLGRRQARYDAEAMRLRPALAGKRLMVVSFNHSIDWLLEAALDTGMTVVRAGILDYTQDSVLKTRFGDEIDFRTGYTPPQRDADIARLRPHLVLSNYAATGLPDTARYDTLPLCPDVGFMSGLALARRWAAVLRGPSREGWQDDRPLFS
jgi:nitrogenase iron protein